MAEEDPKPEPEEELPRIDVPHHDVLPLPPDVPYRRPDTGGQSRSTNRPNANRYEAPGGLGGDAVRYSAGLAGSIAFGAAVFAGFLIGQEIDRRWNHSSTPWGTLVMVLAGTFVGFVNLFRIVNRSEKRNKK